MELRQTPLSSTSLRAEPYRIFFPLAVVIGASGVAPWLLLGAGATARYLGLFHAITQMQSFMLALAAGFLLTAIPKRTRSAPATWIEIAAIAVLLPATAAAAFVDRFALAQIAYAGALMMLAQFAVRRLAGGLAGRRPPASFALVPVGIAAGLTVAAHVTLGHGGFAIDQEGRPNAVAAIGLLFLTAAGPRAVAGLVPVAYFAWLGVAAACWLVGAAVWAAYLLPKMWSVPATGERIP